MGQQHADAAAAQVDGEGNGFQAARELTARGSGHEVAVLAGLYQLDKAAVGGARLGDLAAREGVGFSAGSHGQFYHGLAVVDEGIVVIEIGELDLDGGFTACSRRRSVGRLRNGRAGAHQSHRDDESACDYAQDARLEGVHGCDPLECFF